MRWLLRGGLGVAAGIAAWSAPLSGSEPAAPMRLRLALSSFRDRPLHPRVYFYDHDGVGQGRAAGAIEPVNLRVETHPTLASGGRLCVCASEVENQSSNTLVWDIEARQEVADLPLLNTDAPEVEAAVSADGQWVAFSAWQRPGAPGSWSLFLYHLGERHFVPLPPNTDDDERSPSLSSEGRFVAFTSNRAGGAGLTDIYLFDRAENRLVPLPGLNSAARDTDPALSGDGRFLAFTSNRPGGAGSLDIYLYDRSTASLVPLPVLNGGGVDQSPALTPDGRYLAFVAERVSGEGERDVLLYDRNVGRCLPTPGLNTRSEDFDPAIAYRR